MDKTIDERLKDILAATNDGKIDWKTSDNLIRWTRQVGDRLYVTTIAKSSIGAIVVYSIIIQATQPNEVMFEARGRENSMVGSLMKDIYQKVFQMSQQSNSKIIDDLLNGL